MRARQFIIEYSRAITLQKLGTSLEKSAQREQLSTNEAIAALEEMDPTPNKQYVPWLAKQYIVGQFRTEDASRIKEVLSNFIKIKNRLPVDQRDLGRMDFYKLDDLIDSVMNVDLTKTNDTPAAATFPVVSDSKVLYNGPYGQLSTPETKEASCKLGSGTKWCTAATDDNMFSLYHSDETPLYVWRDKSGSKYQFWFNSNLDNLDTDNGGMYYQFKDARDRPIDAKTLAYFRTQHPVLKKLFVKAESAIAKNPGAAYKYAKHVIKGRWPEGESAIAKNPETAYQYAKYVIKGRFLAGEPAIALKPYNLDYKAFIDSLNN